jgi:formate hydrogenlyase subunit 3/multisubunit Na+/H+ antiporter MnhD subunit
VNVLLWLGPVLLPLLSAVVLYLRPGPRTSWLLVVAPLPAGALAAVGGVLPAPALDWLLLGVELAVDDVTRLLLLLTSLVWSAAAAYSRADVVQQRGYSVLWLLALTGNVGLVLAADVVTFYAAFVVMTFAAYGLVVHTRTPAARRAGRAYMVLGVVGETLVLGGVLLAVTEARSLLLVDVAAAVGESPRRGLLLALLLVGFGIKAGVLGLHVWLPLAHPAAPFPASAALSGAMIKAGLVGWVRLLPLGEVALPQWSDAVILLGVLTAFAGVLLGLTQRDPKVVLAYSSVSQMGFVTVLVGVALRSPEVAPVAVAGAAVYALHHGLAKAGLFLGVGLVRRTSTAGARRVLLGGIVLAAAALTGLPATSGAVAKAWLKQVLDTADVADGVGLALSVAAAGTTVLMVRLVLRIRATAGTATVSSTPSPAPGPGWGALVPWVLLLLAVLVVTALVPIRVLAALEAPSGVVVWDATWPVLLGLALAVAGLLVTRNRTSPVPALPAGNLVVVGERGAVLARRVVTGGATRTARARGTVAGAGAGLVRRVADQRVLVDRVEAWLTRRRTGGVMTVLVALGLLLALTLP